VSEERRGGQRLGERKDETRDVAHFSGASRSIAVACRRRMDSRDRCRIRHSTPGRGAPLTLSNLAASTNLMTASLSCCTSLTAGVITSRPSPG